jgi:hypothetical protein
LHVFALAPSIDTWTRAIVVPRAAAVILTVPTAGDGAETLIDAPNSADAGGTLTMEAIKKAELSKCLRHKAVSSHKAEAQVPAFDQPFLR